MDLEGMLFELSKDNRRLRDAGCKLAEAALRVIRTYDGTHRLASAVAEWSRAVACEGGRCDNEAKRADEQDLVQMMRDPRYWRERDPEFVRRVTDGFSALYPGTGTKTDTAEDDAA